MIKRFLIWLLLIIPLLILIPIMQVVNNQVTTIGDLIYEQVWQEKTRSVQRLSEDIEHLVRSGYQLERYKRIYDNIINTHIQLLESEYGVFAVAINSEMEITSKRDFEGDTNLDPLMISSFKEAIFNAVQGSETNGYITVEWDNIEHKLFYQAIPIKNTIYWAVVSVDKELLVKKLEINRLSIPIFIIGIVFMLETEYLVYWIIKKKKEE